MDGEGNDSPDLEVVGRTDDDGLEVLVAWTEDEQTLGLAGVVELFERELAVIETDGDAAVGGRDAAVDADQVAGHDAGINHGVALHAGIECGLGMADDVAVEVELQINVILGRGGETRMHAAVGVGQGLPDFETGDDEFYFVGHRQRLKAGHREAPCFVVNG